MTTPSEQTYSMRVVRPFLKVLHEKGLPARSYRYLVRADADTRIDSTAAMDLLDRAVQITDDPALGLRAAMHMEAGGYDVMEYAASTCATIREGLDVLRRSFRLISDAGELRIQQDGDRAMLSLHLPGPMGRAAIDFTMGAWYRCHARWCGESPGRWEICFSYPEPENLEMYRVVFGGTSRIRFAAGFDGFAFESSELDQAPPRSDPRLKHVLVGYIEAQLHGIPDHESITQRTRRLILEELRGGDPSARYIAQRLGVSRRTLTRLLEEERTSFKELLGDLRCGLALHYLIVRNFEISEIVRRLGYSEPAAFNKAFKRWFKRPPIEYLRELRPAVPPRAAPRQ